MGIPAFYRWLVERYARTVVDVIEEASGHGVALIDTSGPNPNGTEFDNLYLDMNGIIHPCFHPEGLPAPKSYDDVFKAVFNYIDRIFVIVRPRKLLYLAIDGVAPRAKMNQQRTRRFRAAKGAADELGDLVGSKEENSTSMDQSSKLDSNIITPGTEFMFLLSSALRYYIQLRMNDDPGWRGIKVILSDANVPGEGEHKIMTYIRLQRNLPGYDPNTRHCLYGLDADLIMLALATHEIHFSVLREDLRNVRLNDNKISKSGGKSLLQVLETSQQLEGTCASLEEKISRLKFQFLNIWVLREYLALDMKVSDPRVNGDLERLIDDFVFICLFVGNDFLPHMPSLEISEGAIDLLLTVYKREFIRMGGYLTNSSEVNLKRMQHFVQAVASHESAIFRKRVQVQKERDIRFRHSSNNKVKLISPNKLNITSGGHDAASLSVTETQALMNHTSSLSITVIDKIKLGEDGWKERYYAEKFDAETEDDRERIRKNAVLKYVEGICWVMHYYYVGVCSWQWFYPYHYAPFASDFCCIDEFRVQFEIGKPFKPLDQLMGVLPAASAHALPLFYRKLMTDTASPLSDFYPPDFELDMNGKRFSWQAICKLPFIEESRLLLEIARVEHTLTEEERQRNNVSLDVFFIHISHPLAVKIMSLARGNMDNLKLSDAKVELKIDPNLSGGMNGYVIISDEALRPEQVHSLIEGIETIADNEVLCMFYNCPSFHAHVPRPLKGAIMPEKTIHKQDVLPPPVLWHEKSSIMGRLHSEGPIRKSISGLFLAKSARQLLLKCYVTKELGTRGCMESLDNAGGYGVGKNCNKPTSISNCIMNHLGAEQFIWGAHLTEKRSAGNGEVGGEKNEEDGSCKQKQKGKCGKDDGILGSHAGTSNLNSAFTGGIEVGTEKTERDTPLKKKKKKKQKQKQKGNDPPDNHFRTGEEACSKLNSAFTGGIEVGTEKAERDKPLKKKQKHKEKKVNVTPDHHLRTGEACSNLNSATTGGIEVGTEKAERDKPLKKKRKQKEKKVNVTPDHHLRTVEACCNLNSAFTSGIEVGAEKNEIDKPLKKKRKQKEKKVNVTPDHHLRTVEACCNLNSAFTSGIEVGTEKAERDKPLKKKRKQKEKKVNVTPDHHLRTVEACCNLNSAFTSGIEVGAEKNEIDKPLKKKRKQKEKKVNVTPDHHLRTVEACCNLNSAFTSGIEVGAEKNERDKPLKKKRKQKEKKVNVTPDHHLRTGEACCNLNSAFTGGIEVGTEKNERDRPQKKGNETPDHLLMTGEACDNLNSAFTGGIEAGTEKNEKDRPQKKGNETPDHHLRTGEACNNLNYAFTGGIEVGTEKNERDRPQKKGIETPDHHLRTGEACKLNSGEAIYAGADKDEVGCDTKGEGSHKRRQKRKYGKNNGIPDPHVGSDIVCNLNSVCMGEDEVGKKRRKRKQNKGNDNPDPHYRTGEGSELHSGEKISAVVGKDEVECGMIGYAVSKQIPKQKLSQENNIPRTEGGASDSNMGGIIYAGKVECVTNILEQSKKRKKKKKPKKGNGTLDNHISAEGLACKLTGNEVDKCKHDSIGKPGSNGNCADGADVLDKVECVNDIVDKSRKRRLKKKHKRGSGILYDHISEGLACKLSGTEVDKCKHDSIVRPVSNRNCADGTDLDNYVGAEVLASNSCLKEGICKGEVQGEISVVEKSKRKGRKQKKGGLENQAPVDFAAGDVLNVSSDLRGTIIVNANVDNFGRNCADGTDLDTYVGAEVLASNSCLKEGLCKGEVQGGISVVRKSKKKGRKRKKGGLDNRAPSDFAGGDALDVSSDLRGSNIVNGCVDNFGRSDGSLMLTPESKDPFIPCQCCVGKEASTCSNFSNPTCAVGPITNLKSFIDGNEIREKLG